MKTIINNPKSFIKTLNFIKKYFKNVSVVNNKYSHLANRSQNFYKVILFENRGAKFSIKWNHGYCILYFGNITKKEKTCFQFTFTKLKFDTCYPIEEGNNCNIVFWEIETVGSHDDIPFPVSPFRMPITLK